MSMVATAAGQLGPVDHFWSLSVEEQFYWVWPLVCAALLARGRSMVVVRRWLVGLAVAGIAAAPLVAAGPPPAAAAPALGPAGTPSFSSLMYVVMAE